MWIRVMVVVGTDAVIIISKALVVTMTVTTVVVVGIGLVVEDRSWIQEVMLDIDFVRRFWTIGRILWS